MSRGGKFLVSTMLLAVAGCGGDMGKLEIRSTPSKLARGQQPVPARIAEARGQMALGNVALALEAFRIAAREDPNSTDALLGIAACYDHMGRFDLSRRNYEAALAIAPANTNVLGAFAASLQLQGRAEEALSVRREIAARASAAAAATQQAAAEPALIAPVVAAPVAPPAIAPASAVEIAAAPEPELPARTWASQPVNVTARAPERVAIAAPAIDPVRVEMETEQAAAAPVPAPKPAIQTAAAGQSVTIKLPPARPVQAPIVSLAAAPAPKPVTAAAAKPAAERAPAPAPVDVRTASLPPLKPSFRPVPAPSFTEERGPRLERVSMGEIALVTVPRPAWRATTVARDERSARVRFVPLREASTVPFKVRVLNAARVNRLATRTRSWLMARGWSRMAVGDAVAARSRSLILYPRGQRALAQSLANQFGFAMEERSNVRLVTMLLGRDAARREELRPRTA
jgi:hypothetical protein